VAAGRSFTFENDPDGTRDGDYVIAACTFVASHPGYEGIRRAARRACRSTERCARRSTTTP
jgi:type VI secretion system secreted protein VgrG